MNILDWILFNFTMKEINIYHDRKFKKKTFEEIGKEYGVTRERIRQIEAKIDDKARYFTVDVKLSVTPASQDKEWYARRFICKAQNW